MLPVNAPLHIETNRLTLASLCKSQGYRTAAFGKWHLGMTVERVTDWSVPLKPGPLQVGFDHYYGMAANIGNSPHSFIDDEESPAISRANRSSCRAAARPETRPRASAATGSPTTSWKRSRPT